jgi:hypothetical protein
MVRKTCASISVSEAGSLHELFPPKRHFVVHQNPPAGNPLYRISACSSLVIAHASAPSYTEINSASWSLTRRCPREDESSAVLETQLVFLPSRTLPVLVFLRRILCCAQRFLELVPSRGPFSPLYSPQIAAFAAHL